jgi:hypothetical protein
MESQLSINPEHKVLDVPISSIGLAKHDVVSIRDAVRRVHVVVEG